jgi:hypothetical protein
LNEAGTGVGGPAGFRVTGCPTGGCDRACGGTCGPDVCSVVVGSAAAIGFAGGCVLGGIMICGVSPGWRYHSGAL